MHGHRLSAQVCQILAQSSQHYWRRSLTYNHRAIVGLFRVQADLLECCAAGIVTMLLQVPAEDDIGLGQIYGPSARPTRISPVHKLLSCP